MIVNLTVEQVRALRSQFDQVENSARLGLRGMLVAQLFKDQHGVYRLRTGFVMHAQAKKLIHAAIEEPSL